MAELSDLKLALEVLTSAEPARGFLERLSRQETMALEHTLVRTRRWQLGGNIVGFGIGRRVSAQATPEKWSPGRGELALKIYVAKKHPAHALAPEERIAPQIGLEGIPGKIPVDVEELGPVRLDGYTQRVRPVLPGYSVGHYLEGTGTLGAVVRERARPEQLLLLSNSHVLARSGLAQAGDAIVQQGPGDGGRAPDDHIARLVSWVPFDFSPDYTNLVDAAVAAVEQPDLVRAGIVGVGTPRGTRAPARDDIVQKVGRTTERTWGVVKDLDFRVALSYPTPQGRPGEARFREQVLATRYSDAGDSGSLVLDKDGYAVGLHVGSAPGGSFFSPIAYVLDTLRIDLGV